MLKKVSRGLSRVEAGNAGFPRLVQVTSGFGVASCIQTLSLIVIFLFPLLFILSLILYKVLKHKSTFFAPLAQKWSMGL